MSPHRHAPIAPSECTLVLPERASALLPESERLTDVELRTYRALYKEGVALRKFGPRGDDHAGICAGAAHGAPRRIQYVRRQHAAHAGGARGARAGGMVAAPVGPGLPLRPTTSSGIARNASSPVPARRLPDPVHPRRR